jgi:hypothetical protein
MKFKTHEYYMGKKRVHSKFLFFPRYFGNDKEGRWLEWADILCKYEHSKWEEVRFATPGDYEGNEVITKQDTIHKFVRNSTIVGLAIAIPFVGLTPVLCILAAAVVGKVVSPKKEKISTI